jgi:hypothetical protein
MSKPFSAKAAIAAYCYHDCQGESRPNSYTVKADIRDCKRTDCNLWPHRGWQRIDAGKF